MVPGMEEGLECMYNIKRLLDYCDSDHSLKEGYWILSWSVILHYTSQWIFWILPSATWFNCHIPWQIWTESLQLLQNRT